MVELNIQSPGSQKDEAFTAKHRMNSQQRCRCKNQTSWENWGETDKTKKYLSPFGRMLIHLEDIKTETRKDSLKIEHAAGVSKVFFLVAKLKPLVAKH